MMEKFLVVTNARKYIAIIDTYNYIAQYSIVVAQGPMDNSSGSKSK